MKIEKGPKLWEEAKTLIPWGTSLLSKKSEMFLAKGWPSYFKKAKGIEVTDLDGNTFKDMSYMGIGSCILGYSDDDVNNAVKKVIDNGSMCTLNSPEDVELAKMLIDIHPWAGMVRYARTGGEAMAVAVRIARAYSKKEKLAFCGYHGWHDWYISSNLSDESNLDGHLLPGLEPLGVPRALLNTSLPFHYNKIEELEELTKKHSIGIIVVEPFRHQLPKDNFLNKVSEIAKRIGAVLIFDEITSGWRNNVGGIHLEWGIIPDIAVYAKAMSNGYPMAAIVGKKEVMNSCNDSFISSTYWTERIGPAAAIATIKKLKEKKVTEHIDRIGKTIGDGWKRLAEKHELNIKVLEPHSLVTFTLEYKNSQEIRTLFTQEMLKRGYLASSSVYVCYSHKEKDVVEYLKSIDEVFKILKDSIIKKDTIVRLNGPVAHSGFGRLT